MPKTLACSNISIIYPEFRKKRGVLALTDVSLEFPKNQITCIMGPSGSGKTTLLQVLGGLLNPNIGEILFGDYCLNDLSKAESNALFKNYFGFLPQKVSEFFISDATIFDHLSLLRWEKQYFLSFSEIQEFAQILGVKEFIYSKPKHLSKGQLQRLGLLLILAKNPLVLLLDEPTSHLNRELILSLLEAIREFIKRHGAFVIISTHDPFLANHCDRTFLLEDGRIVAHKEWIDSEEKNKMIDRQRRTHEESLHHKHPIYKEGDRWFRRVLYVSDKGDLRIPRDLLELIGISSKAELSVDLSLKHAIISPFNDESLVANKSKTNKAEKS